MLGNFPSQGDLAVGDQADEQLQGAGAINHVILVQAEKTDTAIDFQILWSILGLLGNYPGQGDLAVGDKIDGQQWGARN